METAERLVLRASFQSPEPNHRRSLFGLAEETGFERTHSFAVNIPLEINNAQRWN